MVTRYGYSDKFANAFLTPATKIQFPSQTYIKAPKVGWLS